MLDRPSTFVEVRINGDAQSTLSTKVCEWTEKPRWAEKFKIVLGPRSTLSFELFDTSKKSKRRSLAFKGDENLFDWPFHSRKLPEKTLTITTINLSQVMFWGESNPILCTSIEPLSCTWVSRRSWPHLSLIIRLQPIGRKDLPRAVTVITIIR